MMKTNSFKLSLLAGLFWLMAGNASTEIPAMVEDMDSIQVTVRTNPLKPEEERFADDWHIQVHAMDDEGNVASPTYYGRTDHTGDATVAVPKYMYSQPLMMDAFNIVWPYTGLGQGYQIFIPPYCSDKALWLIAPFEDALWRYYKDAAARKGEAWNPSQVDCATWLNNLQLLSLTHEVNEELETKSLFAPFAREVLVRAFQNNHHLLVPTRAPICLAEWRHDGGDMTKGQPITTSSTQTHIALDDKTWLPSELNAAKDEDPILVDSRSGTVDQICRGQVAASSQIQVNGASVMPHEHHWLAEDDFLGTIHEQKSALPNLDVTVFNTRHSNGRPKGDSLYDDSCAVTSVVRFTNNDTSDYELDRGTGVYLYGLFGDGRRSEVHLTSDGDTIVDDDDQWVIFKNYNDDGLRVLVVELLGQRQGDFADGLRMIYHPEPDNLFIGLNTKRELNESGLFGNSGYLKYTIHRYDNTDWEGFMTTFKDFANCYESADAWTKQYFNTAGYPGALEVAEFAARSQCFSNSTSNQRWLSDDAGFYSFNTDHGVRNNLVVNPGWLGPDAAYELYIKRDHSAVFRGPRIIAQTDSLGQLMASVPTLLEGDRVLLKAKNLNDLIIPCVATFTGFSGKKGIPYVPGSDTIPPLPTIPSIPDWPSILPGLPSAPGFTLPVVPYPSPAPRLAP